MKTIAVWHPTLLAVVIVLAVGHSRVFAATLIGIMSRAPETTVVLD